MHCINRAIGSVICLSLLISGCTTTTSMTSHQSDAKVDIKDGAQGNLPRTETFTSKTFGNYMFRAQAGDAEPMYGYLPLRFNGGYLAMDILLFMPAIFFNLRSVYHEYEFDLDKHVVKFRQTDKDEWQIYSPTDATAAAQAKQYFSQHAQPAANEPAADR